MGWDLDILHRSKNHTTYWILTDDTEYVMEVVDEHMRDHSVVEVTITHDKEEEENE